MAAGEAQQIMALISKRLRALRKKHNRITGFEESISQGKTLNKDQEEIVRSKPVVTALIEELEKLRLPLSSPPPPASVAVPKEIILAVQNNQQQKEMGDEEEVMTKTDCKNEELMIKTDCKKEEVMTKTDCKICGHLNDGEVSKDDTSSACSGSSQGVTPSPTSEKVEDEEMGWIEVVRRRKRAPQEAEQGEPKEAPQGAPQAPRGAPQGRGRGRGRGRQGPPARNTYNRQPKRPASN